MEMTRHAEIRSRQRGFNPILLDIIANFGRYELTRNGATRVTLGKRDKKRVIKDLKRLIQLLNISTTDSKSGALSG